METHYTITSEADPEQQSVKLVLNGSFSEAALPELQASILQAQEAEQHVFIDLGEVTLVDRKAMAYFSEQAHGKVTLINCPAYLQRWLTRVNVHVQQ